MRRRYMWEEQLKLITGIVYRLNQDYSTNGRCLNRKKTPVGGAFKVYFYIFVLCRCCFYFLQIVFCIFYFWGNNTLPLSLAATKDKSPASVTFTIFFDPVFLVFAQ